MSSHIPKWSVGYHQDVGKRSNQEDRADLYWEGCVFCLCDGMGGHSDGEKASKHITKRFLENARELHQSGLLTPENIEKKLSSALEKANQALQTRKSRGEIGTDAGCTFLAACIIDDLIYFLSVGDSLILADKLTPAAPHVKEPSFVLNKDVFDSKENELVKVYGKSPEEAKQDPRAHALTRAITGRDLHPYSPFGSKEKENVPHFLGPYRLEQGSRIILASDGILSLSSREDLHMLETEVRAILQRCPVPNSQLADSKKALDISEVSAEYLIKKVLEKNKRGQDNVTVMVIDICADDGCMVPDPYIKQEVENSRAKSKSIPLHQRKGEVSIINDSDDTPHYSRSLFGGKIPIHIFVSILIAIISVITISLVVYSAIHKDSDNDAFEVSIDGIAINVETQWIEPAATEFKLKMDLKNGKKELAIAILKKLLEDGFLVPDNTKKPHYVWKKFKELREGSAIKSFIVGTGIAPAPVSWGDIESGQKVHVVDDSNEFSCQATKCDIDNLNMEISGEFEPQNPTLIITQAMVKAQQGKKGELIDKNGCIEYKRFKNFHNIIPLLSHIHNDLYVKLESLPDSDKLILKKDDKTDPVSVEVKALRTCIQPNDLNVKIEGKHFIVMVDKVSNPVRDIILEKYFQNGEEIQGTEASVSDANIGVKDTEQDRDLEQGDNNNHTPLTLTVNVTQEPPTTNNGNPSTTAESQTEITDNQKENFKVLIKKLATNPNGEFKDISIEKHHSFKIKVEKKKEFYIFTIEDCDSSSYTIANEFDKWYNDNNNNSEHLDDLLEYMDTILKTSKDYRILLNVKQPLKILASYKEINETAYNLLFAFFTIDNKKNDGNKVSHTEELIANYTNFQSQVASIAPSKYDEIKKHAKERLEKVISELKKGLPANSNSKSE